jgi:hypothetical protein
MIYGNTMKAQLQGFSAGKNAGMKLGLTSTRITWQFLWQGHGFALNNLSRFLVGPLLATCRPPASLPARSTIT